MLSSVLSKYGDTIIIHLTIHLCAKNYCNSERVGFFSDKDEIADKLQETKFDPHRYKRRKQKQKRGREDGRKERLYLLY